MVINEEITEQAFRKKINKLLGIGEYSFDIMIKASNEYDIIDPKKHYTIMDFINKRNANIFLLNPKIESMREFFSILKIDS